ncbi:MAG TPA: GFA family protein [Sphingobium sp.]|uniref:GFA family protein n=1 Tax=Sphingobium sp. TaxID=1912891 RepID=UPI002ED21E0E
MTMKDPILPLEGHCRCGATRISISAPPMLTAACHCTGCQRMSASAFSLSVAIPAEGFEVTQGSTVLGGAGRDRHHFCPECLTWMFTRAPDLDSPDLDRFVNVRATLFIDTSWFVPFVETHMTDKLAWVPSVAPHSFIAVPSMEGYSRLIEDYAKAVGRRE